MMQVNYSIDDCVLIGSGTGGRSTMTGHDNILIGSKIKHFCNRGKI